jgi:transposase
MRPKGTPEELERRRRRAIALLAQGFTQGEVAERVGSSLSSVKRWKSAFEEQGDTGLDPIRHPGPKPRLDAEQSTHLLDLLTLGARAHGWATDLWTCPRIVVVIERHFGVRFHEDHIGRLLRTLGWTPQKPQRRARQRNEARIEHWLRNDWPRIKKTPAAGGPGSSSPTRRASRSRPR